MKTNYPSDIPFTLWQLNGLAEMPQDLTFTEPEDSIALHPLFIKIARNKFFPSTK